MPTIGRISPKGNVIIEDDSNTMIKLPGATQDSNFIKEIFCLQQVKITEFVRLFNIEPCDLEGNKIYSNNDQAEIKNPFNVLPQIGIIFKIPNQSFICQSSQLLKNGQGTQIIKSLPYPIFLDVVAPVAFKSDISFLHTDASLGPCVVAYAKQSNEDGEATIEITRFALVKDKIKEPKYYKNFPVQGARNRLFEKNVIGDIIDKNDIEMICKEIQVWDSSDNLCWAKMTRYDKDGNVLLRCNRLNVIKKQDGEQK